jgi:hypothetical protein
LGIKVFAKILLTQLCTARGRWVLAQGDRFLTFCDCHGTAVDHTMAGSSIPDTQPGVSRRILTEYVWVRQIGENSINPCGR